MNKKDFWTLVIMNVVSLILLIECCCGLETAICCLCVWTIISMIVHIWVLSFYVRLSIFIEEE